MVKMLSPWLTLVASFLETPHVDICMNPSIKKMIILKAAKLTGNLVNKCWVVYSRTPLIRPPSESHWCGRIRGMVAREGFI